MLERGFLGLRFLWRAALLRLSKPQVKRGCRNLNLSRKRVSNFNRRQRAAASVRNLSAIA